MTIDTTFLRQRIGRLELAVQKIQEHQGEDDISMQLYRTACVAEFELVLEQCGKLLRKLLANYLASNRKADSLNFRDLFRHATHHDILDCETVERWLSYRDNRNDTELNNGENFRTCTLLLLPTFVEDAKALADVIDCSCDE